MGWVATASLGLLGACPAACRASSVTTRQRLARASLIVSSFFVPPANPIVSLLLLHLSRTLSTAPHWLGSRQGVRFLRLTISSRQAYLLEQRRPVQNTQPVSCGHQPFPASVEEAHQDSCENTRPFVVRSPIFQSRHPSIGSRDPGRGACIKRAQPTCRLGSVIASKLTAPQPDISRDVFHLHRSRRSPFAGTGSSFRRPHVNPV